MPDDRASLAQAPAVFDLSAQYDMQRRAFLPIFGVLVVGLVLVEVLSVASISREYPHASTASVDEVLVLVAFCFGAALVFVLALLLERSIRQLRIDDSGIHLVRTWGREVDHLWADPSFRLEVWESTPGLGVRQQPPPEMIRVIGRGVPFDLEVPFRAYELAVASASQRGIPVRAWTKVHHGRFGTVYWWITAFGKPT